MIRHITRATRHLLFWSLIVLALGMTGVRFALSSVEGYKARLATRVAVMVGAPVRIGRLGARMRGFSPEMVLGNIGIAAQAPTVRNAVELKEIRLGLNLLDALLKRDLLASSWITLVGVKLTVKRNAEGKLSVAGLKASEGNPLWLLETGKYEVLDSDITWQDEQRQGKSLTFNSVDLALINEGDRHRVNVLMDLPKKFGESLRVSMEVEGDLFDFASLEGRAYLYGRRLNLPEWMTVGLPLSIDLASGRGDLRLWSAWRKNQSIDFSGRINLGDLKLNRAGLTPFTAEKLQGRFYLGLSGKQWQLNLHDLVLATAEGGQLKTWPEGTFSVKGLGDAENRTRQLALYAERLDLQVASRVGRFMMPNGDGFAKALDAADLNGEVRNFSLFADLAAETVSADGEILGVGFSPDGGRPGFKNLTGHVRGNREQGRIDLDSRGAEFSAPNLFRAALPLDRLEGTVTWRQTGEGLMLNSSQLDLESRGIKMRNRLAYLHPNPGAEAFIDLQSEYSCPNVQLASQYLPAKIMGPGVVSWLDHAFVKGFVPHGGFILYGNPDQFPFKGSEGVFLVDFDVKNLELAYQPGWPNLADADAEVVFYQSDLRAEVRQGSSYEVNVQQAKVEIKNLEAADKLEIQGGLKGQINQALDFVRHSPLAERAEAFLRAATPQGDAAFDLNLSIPLQQGGDYDTRVTASLDNAELKLKSPNLTVRKVAGKLRFDNRGVESENLTAEVFGSPVKGALATLNGQTEIRAEGRVALENLRAQLDLDWLNFAEGETRYRLTLLLPHAAGDPSLAIQSDLRGVGLDLPDMLAKPPSQAKPLLLNFLLAAEQKTLPVKVQYGDDFSAALHVDLNAARIQSGHVLLGAGRADFRDEPGILLHVEQKELRLQDWLGLAAGQASKPNPHIEIAAVKVHGDQTFWGQDDIGRFDLDLRRSKGFWEGMLDNALMRGRLKLPVDLNGAERIELELERIDVSGLSRLKTERPEPASAIDSFPLLSVRSAQTFWESADLGRFTMDTERIPGGLKFDRFELQGKDQTLTLTGDWVAAGGQSETRAKGRLELVKRGELFARLGISKDLTETSGHIDLDWHWPAAPHRFSLSALQGGAKVAFKSGRILSIEPGFGRVLGMLAMAQWLKRLQLDFSDIFQEGLTFDSIQGNFKFGQGKAVTEDLVVDAVPAKISIVGETDFVHRTVDHVVTVTPKSAEAVPIAGTIMGKFAALIDKTITGTEHEGFFFGSQYLVKGGWGNAVVLNLHDKEGLLQKTWSGITDFPSLLKNKK